MCQISVFNLLKSVDLNHILHGFFRKQTNQQDHFPTVIIWSVSVYGDWSQTFFYLSKLFLCLYKTLVNGG